MRKVKRNRKRAATELPMPVIDAREQQRLFREKFGRDPEPADPLFFDPDADEPQFVPEGKLEAEMVRAMNAAGTDPAFIYAYKVTGLMVTEHNRDALPDEDVLEWDAAVEEFHQGERG